MIEMTVPSKTFLLGEYAVLNGGPALVLCTEKRFALRAIPNTLQRQDFYTAIHPLSPGGKLIASDIAFYQQYCIEFTDPYAGLGGLGASSAQFLMLYALKHGPLKEADMMPLLHAYLAHAHTGAGLAPSGADVIAQAKGRLCYFFARQQQLASLAWPFPGLYFCLLHTGKKVATHEHLSQMEKSNTDVLEDIVKVALTALHEHDEDRFIRAIDDYAQALAAKHWVAPHTALLLQQIKEHAGVLTCKGCGALGADIVLVILREDHIANFGQWAAQHALRVIALTNTPSAGLKHIVS